MKLHKLIYKFTEDLDDLVHDVKLAEQEASGELLNRKILGSGSILEVFDVSSGKGSRTKIFGSKVQNGQLFARHKYSVSRNDELIADELTIESLKQHKKTMSSIDKGQECGISFNSRRGLAFEFQRGDVL